MKNACPVGCVIARPGCLLPQGQFQTILCERLCNICFLCSVRHNLEYQSIRIGKISGCHALCLDLMERHQSSDSSLITLCPPRCLTTHVNCARRPAATVMFSKGDMNPGLYAETERKRTNCIEYSMDTRYYLRVSLDSHVLSKKLAQLKKGHVACYPSH